MFSPPYRAHKQVELLRWHTQARDLEILQHFPNEFHETGRK